MSVESLSRIERATQELTPWEEYRHQSEFLEKATVAFASMQNPSLRTFGRGSHYVDEQICPELHDVKVRINRVRIPRDIHLLEYAEPGLYPASLDRNMKVETDEPSYLARLYNFFMELGIHQQMTFPQKFENMKEWKRNLPQVREAWERNPPKDVVQLVHQVLMHKPPIPVIWNTLWTDVFGRYPDGYGTRQNRAADMNVTSTPINGLPDRRDWRRCFTFDGLRVLLSLDPGVVEALKSTKSPSEMRVILESSLLRSSKLHRPRYSTLSPDAQEYYNESLPQGDEEAQDTLIEAAIREQRKVKVAHRKFDPNILAVADGYMQMAASDWQKRRHEASLLEGYLGDIMVACELGSIGAFDNIRKTGLWRVFAPEVQNIFRDEKAANEVKRRIRQIMSRDGFDHMASISPQRWWAVNHAIGSLIWPNHPVLPRGASRLLRPVDAGSPFDPWAE